MPEPRMPPHEQAAHGLAEMFERLRPGKITVTRPTVTGATVFLSFGHLHALAIHHGKPNMDMIEKMVYVKSMADRAYPKTPFETRSDRTGVYVDFHSA